MLPTSKGTETFPTTTKIPVKVVVVGAESNEAAKAVLDGARGTVNQFYTKAAQDYALGVAQSSHRVQEHPGLRLRYRNQFGVETVYVEATGEVRRTAAVAVEPPTPGVLWDWLLIDFVSNIYSARDEDGVLRTVKLQLAVSPTEDSAPVTITEAPGAFDQVGGSDTSLEQQVNSFLVDLNGTTLDGPPVLISVLAAMDDRSEFIVNWDGDEEKTPTSRRLAGVIMHQAHDLSEGDAVFDRLYVPQEDDADIIAARYSLTWDQINPTYGNYSGDLAIFVPGRDLDADLDTLLTDPANFTPDSGLVSYTEIEEFISPTSPQLGNLGYSTVAFSVAVSTDGGFGYTTYLFNASDETGPIPWADGRWLGPPTELDRPTAPPDLVFPGSGVTTEPLPGSDDLGFGLITHIGEPWGFARSGPGDHDDFFSFFVGPVPTPPPSTPTPPDGYTLGYTLGVAWLTYVFLPMLPLQGDTTVTISAAAFHGQPPWAWSEHKAPIVQEAQDSGDEGWNSYRWETTDIFPDRHVLGEIASGIPVTETTYEQIGTIEFRQSTGRVTFTPVG